MKTTRQTALYLLLCVTLSRVCSAQLPSDTRLLFSKELQDSCEISIWDPNLAEADILATEDSCPKAIFLSPDESRLYVVDDNLIREVPFDSQQPARVAAELPDLNFLAYQDIVSVQPSAEYLQISMKTMIPLAVGYQVDGRLALRALLRMAADDSYNYLFTLEDGVWEITDERWCDRMERQCEFESLQGKTMSVWDWEANHEIWHEDIRNNPYFVDEESMFSPDQFGDAYSIRRSFLIDNETVSLSFTTSPSHHYSDETDTFSINLEIGDKPPIVLSEGQCLTALADRYILVRQFRGETLEVIDMGTGSSVFGPLKHAIWIDWAPVQ